MKLLIIGSDKVFSIENFYYKYLIELGVDTKRFTAQSIFYDYYFSGNILLHPGYKHLDDYKKYPNSNKALSHVFFMGCSPLYNDKILDYIEKVCKEYT
jgi:hypothetical protein